MIFSTVNGVIKNKIGAKNSIILGFIQMTITSFGLGMLSLIKYPEYFKIAGIIIRFL
jgi:hypothetical protein